MFDEEIGITLAILPCTFCITANLVCPVDVKYLPPVTDDVTASVFEHRKRVVKSFRVSRKFGKGTFAACSAENEGSLCSACKRTYLRSWSVRLGLHS